MSEHMDQVAAAYSHMIDSPGGKLLMEWLDERINQRRQGASEFEPTTAWGELKFADGLEEVKTHILQMSILDEIK